uniref:Uncharacterized protein n=1 Tax=Lactuca sativa TaxID=4236 RepID=A0A9R1UM42_LACSA|nr:hypothetical protein LSAT_V11C800422230 [Lactuca sativa]
MSTFFHINEFHISFFVFVKFSNYEFFLVGLYGSNVCGEGGAEFLASSFQNIIIQLMLFIFVINMKHLPKSPPPLTRHSSQPVPRPSGNLATSTPLSPTPTSITLQQADPKRDSRRDPRRHDPSRVVGTPSDHIVEDATSLTQRIPNEQQVGPDEKLNIVSDVAISPIDSHEQKSTDIITMTDEDHLPSSSFLDEDQLSPPGRVETAVMEETYVDLPAVPSYVELTEEEQTDARKMAIKRIIDCWVNLKTGGVYADTHDIAFSTGCLGGGRLLF